MGLVGHMGPGFAFFVWYILLPPLRLDEDEYEEDDWVAPSLRPIKPVTVISQSRQNVLSCVQLPVERGCENRDLWVQGFNGSDSFWCCQDAHDRDVLAAILLN